MFSDEIKKLLVEVITSWQVLAVTGVLIVYIFLVNYVARTYRPRRRNDLGIKNDMPEITAPSESGELNAEEESPGEK